jgi:hypothetical protein
MVSGTKTHTTRQYEDGGQAASWRMILWGDTSTVSEWHKNSGNGCIWFAQSVV